MKRICIFIICLLFTSELLFAKKLSEKIFKSVEIINSFSYDENKHGLLIELGTYDECIKEYAFIRKEKKNDVKQEKAIAALKALLKIAEESCADDILTVEFCRYSLASTLMNSDKKVEAFDLMSKCLNNTLNKDDNDKLAAFRLLVRLDFEITQMENFGESPTMWKVVAEIASNVLSFYNSHHSYGQITELTYYSLGQLEGMSKLYEASYEKYINSIVGNKRLRSIDYFNKAEEIIVDIYGEESLDRAIIVHEKANHYLNKQKIDENQAYSDIVTRYIQLVKQEFYAGDPLYDAFKSLEEIYSIVIGGKITYDVKETLERLSKLNTEEFYDKAEQLAFFTLQRGLEEFETVVKMFNDRLVKDKKKTPPLKHLARLYKLIYIMSNANNISQSAMIKEYCDDVLKLYDVHHEKSWTSINLGLELGELIEYVINNKKLADKIRIIAIEDAKTLYSGNISDVPELYKYMAELNLQEMEHTENTDVPVGEITAIDYLSEAYKYHNAGEKQKMVEACQKALSMVDNQDEKLFIIVNSSVGSMFINNDISTGVDFLSKAADCITNTSISFSDETLITYSIGTAYDLRKSGRINAAIKVLEKLRSKISFGFEYNKDHHEVSMALKDIFLHDKHDYMKAWTVLDEQIRIYNKCIKRPENQKLYLNLLWERLHSTEVLSNYNETAIMSDFQEITQVISKLVEASDYDEELQIELLVPYIRTTANYVNNNRNNSNAEKILNLAESLIDILCDLDNNYKTRYEYYDLLYAIARFHLYLTHDMEEFTDILNQFQEDSEQYKPETIGSWINLKAESLLYENKKTECQEFIKECYNNPLYSNHINETDVLMSNVFTAYLGHSYNAAFDFLYEAYKFEKAKVENNLLFLSQEERDTQLSSLAQMSSGIYSIFDKTDHINSDIVYNIILFQKNQLLRSMRTTVEAINTSNNEHLLSLYDEISKMRKELSHNEKNRIDNVSNIDKDDFFHLYSAIEKKEKELNLKIVQELGISLKTPQWQDVQNNLRKGDIAIEYILTDSVMGALVIDKSMKTPCYVTLPSPVDLLKEMNSLSFLDEDEMIKRLYETDSLRLYERIWLPLEPYLKNSKRVFVSPTGVLSFLSYNAIKTKERKLLGDIYRLSVLSSTGELSKVKLEKNEKLKDAAIYGGILYDGQLSNQPVSDKEPHNRAAINDLFEELENTKKEKDLISDIVNKSGGGILCKKYEGLNATEQSLRDYSGKSPSILHLATHGYTLKNEEQIEETVYMEKFPQFKNHALYRCGIALANCNLSWRGDFLDDSNDGIMTGIEVSQLDFSNTKLVVLSTCESGLGMITHEGIAGLQRGFKLAGVQSILMSLWKVDDAATCKLMTEFYSNWIGKKMTKHDALEAAKKTVRGTKGWEDPKYWAAFILLDGLE